jgi:hypothetical protein
MYNITTICFGNKYTPIREHWEKMINKNCIKKNKLTIWDESNILQSDIKVPKEYAFWDSIRLKKNIDLLINEKKPVVHCDMDIILKNDIDEIVNLPYDFIISTEIGGKDSFPKECSNKLGFGVCSGFYIIKLTSLNFIIKLLKNMIEKKNNSYSDQVNLMNYIISSDYKLHVKVEMINGNIYNNKILEIDGIKICVLDFELIERDPIITKNQIGMHINVDNVGGVINFIKYFYENLEDLPLTCRCGKRHLGDNNICKHIELREKNR